MNVGSTQSIQFNSISNSITSDKVSTVENILSKYDSKSLSQSDAEEIVQSFKEAEIEPTMELASLMASVGFDAQKVAELAGAKPPHGQGIPPIPPSEEEISAISDLLQSLLNSDEDSESQTLDVFEPLLEHAILRLNDEVKSDVVDMLEEYASGDELAYTQEDVLDKLGNILNNLDNYKRISFYV